VDDVVTPGDAALVSEYAAWCAGRRHPELDTASVSHFANARYRAGNPLTADEESCLFFYASPSPGGRCGMC
jgi:hypothetical protein